MASISRERGRRRIQFVAADGKRKALRLGKVPQRLAGENPLRGEAIVSAQIAGSPLDAETARWLTAVGDSLARKLARLGLAPQRPSARLGEFLETYIAGRADVKPGTRRTMQTARLRLVASFGVDK